MIQIFFNSPIFITFVVRTFYVAKYRTVKKIMLGFLVLFDKLLTLRVGA